MADNALPRGGYAGQILDVDLTARKVTTRPTAPYIRDALGGRALSAAIAWDEMPADVDAFDPAALIIISTGPLTGTLAPTTGRTVMASLSPRIYPKPWYTHSTIGGWFGPELKYAGYDAVIIRGAASAPVRLEITDGKARIVDAADLWGLDARETQLDLKRRLSSETQVLAIGPAGENRVRFATVQHSEENAAGHSGFGAVWGSKNLKAVTARGTGGVKVADPAAAELYGDPAARRGRQTQADLQPGLYLQLRRQQLRLPGRRPRGPGPVRGRAGVGGRRCHGVHKVRCRWDAGAARTEFRSEEGSLAAGTV
jgi:aldehyde:ferredoxin oxidoreductase